MVRLAQIIGAAALLSSSVLAAPAVRRDSHEASYQPPAQYGSDQEKPSYDQEKPSYDQEKPSYDQWSEKPSYDQEKPSYDQEKPSYDQPIEVTTVVDDTTAAPYEATATYETKSVEETSVAHPIPTYGSGQSNWGKSYEDCVSKCVAQYGAPPQEWAPKDPIAPPEGTGAVHTVMVAPMKGVLRYFPFAVNATIGDTIRYVWTQPANHTATLASALAICNRSAEAEKLNWVSGVRNATDGQPQTFDVKLTTDEQQFFYCSVATHCEKGMFGMVQPKMGGNNTVSLNMNKWLENNPDLKAAWAVVHEKTKDSPADTWGNNINIDDIPEEAHMDLAKNIVYSRAMFAANPGSLEANSAETADGSPLDIVPDLNTLLASTSQDPASNSVPAGTPTAPVPDSSSVASELAAQATQQAAKTGSGLRTSAPVWVAAFVGAISYLVL
jgi:plastocyanin